MNQPPSAALRALSRRSKLWARTGSLGRPAPAAPTGAAARKSPGAGGSAMSCGLVLPAARAKLAEATCEPEVRLAALLYW
jgi:hypothetical protein